MLQMSHVPWSVCTSALAWCHQHSAVMATELLQPRDLTGGTLLQSSCVISTSPTDCSDDSWKETFFEKHEHGALWLLICSAIEKHLLTYLDQRALKKTAKLTEMLFRCTLVPHGKHDMLECKMQNVRLHFNSSTFTFGSSVLWRCWLGGRKGIWNVKNWVVGCWRGYLSGARCRLAYGPADATATHCLCFSKVQIGSTFLVLAHPGSPGQRAVKRVCVCVLHSGVSHNQFPSTSTFSLCLTGFHSVELVPDGLGPTIYDD